MNPQEQALTAELITRVAYNYHWAKTKRGDFPVAQQMREIFFCDRAAQKRSLLCVPRRRQRERRALVGLCAGIKLLLCLVCVKLVLACVSSAKQCTAAMQISQGRILFAASACYEVTLYTAPCLLWNFASALPPRE